MNQTEETLNPLFFQLVVSLQGGAMHQMGKIASPLTGKVERDLDMAKSSIDLLGMIKDKTEGNLTDEEKKLLDHILYELRLNYVDELKKGDAEPADKEADDTASSGDEPARQEASAETEGPDQGKSD
ncbi:MAG: DUF1844 domain-containing protein [candidate division Zixibacteria bacterium]|jgi:hypothetical protein|nr:DUF1844 domain-containing protein [candidate division Zixibacteria bacterium]